MSRLRVVRLRRWLAKELRRAHLMVEMGRYATDRAVYTAGPAGPAARAEYERRESRGGI